MRRSWWKRPPGHAILVFGATFVVLVATGFAAMRLVPELAFARQEVPPLDRPDPSFMPVYFRGGTQLDHVVTWNDIGGAMQNARRADVLFFGTSQMQFALPPHAVRAFTRRTGLTAYSLALPFAERDEFALALIEKYDLRPRVAVVNVTGFFTNDESMVGLKVRADGYWPGLASVWEERLAAMVWPSASRVLPSFVTPRPARTLLRSTSDGTWQPVRWTHDHNRVAVTPMPIRWAMRAAVRFRNELVLRGASLVLVCVPSAVAPCAPEALRPLAVSLGARMVIPTVDAPMWTGDLAHLCPLSGKRYARAMLRQLGELDVIRAIRPKRRLDRQPT